MKKAAAAAAAAKAAAAAAAAAEKTNNNDNGNNNNNNVDEACFSENNENGDNKTDLRAMRANMQKLMNLAKNMKSMPSTSRKSQASSASVSSGSDSSDSDDAVTVVQQAVKPATGTGTGAGAGAVDSPEFVPIPKFSRGEKKARRLLMKLDLEKVANVSRVTMRKAKNVLLCIDQPEVYKCLNTKTLICFGEVRVEDTSNAAAAQAAERYLNDANVRSSAQSKDGDQLNDVQIDNDDDDNEEGNLDDSQLDEKDIELVQMQAECSRQKAIKALFKHKSDVVNAIMDLTVG
ncbi:hypothetical protein ACLKA7_004035 [Drosophila subpalustris]